MNGWMSQLAMLSLAALLLPNGVLAVTDFGVPQLLNSYGETDEGFDTAPTIATDGNGTWIVGWGSNDVGLGITGARAPVISRSADDGVTWSSPTLLRPEFASTLGSSPSIAAGEAGRWLAAWDGGPGVSISPSSDGGASWDVPQALIGSGGDDRFPSVATGGAGMWVVVWQSTNSLGGTIGVDEDILFSRSGDDGATWSAPAPLNSDAAIDSRFDLDPHIATDGDVWVVIWDTFDDVVVSRSTDDGLTWSTPQVLSSSLTADNITTDVTTDGGGAWVAVWSNDEAAGGHHSEVLVSASADDGATWSSAALIHPYFEPPNGGYHAQPKALSLGNSAWQIVWESNDPLGGSLGASDADVLTSYSRDNGVTWTGPAALTVRGRSDDGLEDSSPNIARTSNGRVIAVWGSGDAFDNPEIDYDIHFAASVMDCSLVAREDCLTSTESDGSKLSIKDSPKGNDRLSWRLKRGQSTSDLQLGDPTTTDDYVLCLYEKIGGTPGLIAEWDAKAATSCRNKPCWTAVSGQVDYKDSGLEQGSIKKMRIRGGADGETSVRLAASGPALSPPRLPLDTTSPVRIQLVNLGTNTCWEGAHDQASKNDDARFSSTSD